MKLFENKKTTFTGIGLLLTGIAWVAFIIAGEDPVTVIDGGGAFSTIVAGLGFLFSKDDKL